MAKTKLEDIKGKLKKWTDEDEEKRGYLTQLLDEFIQKSPDWAIAVKSEMGITSGVGGKFQTVPSYLTSLSIRYLSNKANISLGVEMSFMSDAVDKDTGKLKISGDNITRILSIE